MIIPAFYTLSLFLSLYQILCKILNFHIPSQTYLKQAGSKIGIVHFLEVCFLANKIALNPCHQEIFFIIKSYSNSTV